MSSRLELSIDSYATAGFGGETKYYRFKVVWKKVNSVQISRLTKVTWTLKKFCKHVNEIWDKVCSSERLSNIPVAIMKRWLLLLDTYGSLCVTVGFVKPVSGIVFLIAFRLIFSPKKAMGSGQLAHWNYSTLGLSDVHYDRQVWWTRWFVF